MKLKYVLLTVLVYATLCGNCDKGFVVYLPEADGSIFSTGLLAKKLTLKQITTLRDNIYIDPSNGPILTFKTFNFEIGPDKEYGKGYTTKLTLTPSEGNKTVYLLDFNNPLCYLWMEAQLSGNEGINVMAYKGDEHHVHWLSSKFGKYELDLQRFELKSQFENSIFSKLELNGDLLTITMDDGYSSTRFPIIINHLTKDVTNVLRSGSVCQDNKVYVYPVEKDDGNIDDKIHYIQFELDGWDKKLRVFSRDEQTPAEYHIVNMYESVTKRRGKNKIKLGVYSDKSNNWIKGKPKEFVVNPGPCTELIDNLSSLIEDRCFGDEYYAVRGKDRVLLTQSNGSLIWKGLDDNNQTTESTGEITYFDYKVLSDLANYTEVEFSAQNAKVIDTYGLKSPFKGRCGAGFVNFLKTLACDVKKGKSSLYDINTLERKGELSVTEAGEIYINKREGFDVNGQEITLLDNPEKSYLIAHNCQSVSDWLKDYKGTGTCPDIPNPYLIRVGQDKFYFPVITSPQRGWIETNHGNFPYTDVVVTSTSIAFEGSNVTFQYQKKDDQCVSKYQELFDNQKVRDKSRTKLYFYETARTSINFGYVDVNTRKAYDMNGKELSWGIPIKVKKVDNEWRFGFNDNNYSMRTIDPKDISLIHEHRRYRNSKLK
jgi:hypothetical protein